MQQTTARPSLVPSPADRTPAYATPLSITLGINNRTASPHGIVTRGWFPAFALMTTDPRAAEAQSSAEPELLLTEADFAPPDQVLSILLRIAGLSVLAIAAGAVAYLALAQIS